MKQIVNVDLSTKTTDWVPPVFAFGEQLTLAIYFTKDVNGNSAVPNFTFSSAEAAIGLVDARPTGGATALQIGPNPATVANITAAIQANDSAAHVAAAINALAAVVGTYGNCTAQKVQGSWLLHFGDGSQEVPIQAATNGLWPLSVVNVSAYQVQSKWVHEVRFVQSPLAYYSTSSVVVVGALPPSVTQVRAGFTTSDGGLVDALQQIVVPADFAGAYTINFNGLSTAQLAPTSGAAVVQAAMVAAFGAGITVSLPQSFTLLVDFGGDFAGDPQPELTITVVQAPPGALTVTLDLGLAAMNAALRAVGAPANTVPSITVPLSVSMECSEDGGPTQSIVAFAIPITIQGTLFLPALELTPEIDFLQPLSPVSYSPVGAQNILTAGQAYAISVGTGATTSFAVTHGLATEDVLVFVRDIPSGKLLVLGTDYSVTINSVDQVTVAALLIVPDADPQWRVVVYSSWAVAQWANGLTLTESQVTGLVTDLANLQANVATLNTLLPGSASQAASASATSAAFTIAFPAASGFLFARDGSGNPITAAASLPKGGAYLLPAINTTTTPTSLTALPLPALSAGVVWQNNTGQNLPIPVGGMIRGRWCANGGFFGSDGRTLYPLTRSAPTDSWYPTPFELLLWEEAINGMMFSSGTTLTAAFGLALQTIAANSECRWTLVIEVGTITADVSGTSYDPYNLGAITWNVATPILRQPITLTNNLITHNFGCTITQTSGTIGVVASSTGSTSVTLAGATLPANFGVGSLLLGQTVTAISGTAVTLAANASATIASATSAVFITLTANALPYARIVNANAAAPACPTFAIRARMINFDTKDSVPWARGWVSWALVAPTTGTLGITIQ